MADLFAGIGDFINKNLIVIIIIAGAVFLLYSFIKVRYKSKKFISRAEIERDNRIKQILINGNQIGESVFNNLFHGRVKIGVIKAILSAKDSKEEIAMVGKKTQDEFLEIVYRPPSRFGFILPKHLELLRVYDTPDTILKDYSHKAIIVLPNVSIDGWFGWHYDLNNTTANRNAIMFHTYKTDAESLGDEYYAESQKRSTIDQDKAHEITQKQLELQIERERRARAVTGSS